MLERKNDLKLCQIFIELYTETHTFEYELEY
jgi:hypothetical protein